MRRIGEHAVVIGGSMSGLLAARSLTDAYERVTIVDRDALGDGLQGRKVRVNVGDDKDPHRRSVRSRHAHTHDEHVPVISA